MRRVVVLALLLVARLARADEPDPDPPVKEARPYWLHGTLDGVTAKLGMRLQVDVDPGSSNTFDITLPTGGVVTGAVLVLGNQTHRLTLDESDHAQTLFEAAAKAAVGPHQHWIAQLSTTMQSTVTLAVAAPRATTMTVDLEVDVPTCFVSDARYFSIAKSWRTSVDSQLEVSNKPRGSADGPCAAGAPIDADDVWIRLPTSAVSAKPFGERRIATIANRVDVAHGHYGRIEVDLASQISQIPQDLMTVFVIDGSRSISDSELETQRELVESYARQAPGTQIQIVAYARKARALLPGWMMASYAQTRIARVFESLELRNGSNLDAGLVEASRWLEHATGTRRVIVFTDELVGARVDGLPEKVLRDALPAHTLVHVVALDKGSASDVKILFRDDDAKFAHLAIDSEGLAMRAMGDPTHHFDALELLRPIAFEKIAMKSEGWRPIGVEETLAAGCSLDGTGDLAEGSACVFWAEATRLATAVRLEGLLWNHKVSRVLVPDGEGRMLARMMTGLESTFSGANQAAEKELQTLALAVNPVWSMVGTWGGSDGYGPQPEPFTYGSIGGGTCGGGSHDIGIGTPTLVIHNGSLTDQLSRAIRACRIKSRIEVEVELTLSEIVDVQVAGANAPEHDCVTEAVWETTLTLSKPTTHDKQRVVLLP